MQDNTLSWVGVKKERDKWWVWLGFLGSRGWEWGMEQRDRLGNHLHPDIWGIIFSYIMMIKEQRLWRGLEFMFSPGAPYNRRMEPGEGYASYPYGTLPVWSDGDEEEDGDESVGMYSPHVPGFAAAMEARIFITAERLRLE